jgi:phosphoglycolate phosphatase-like HAD superfamily hydrolase
MTAETLLASWRDTPARKAVTDFVENVTSEGSAGFAEPSERVAVFDNDGTLWSEKPIPIQLDFTLFRMAELARADPSLRGRQPYQAAVERDYRWLGEAMVKHYHGDDADLRPLMAAVGTAFGGMTVEAFSDEVRGWLASASHPQLRRPYLSCAFVPMIELLRYLEANGFSTYIASGGDRDFMRPFAEQLYGIPPERVIGSAFGWTCGSARKTPTCSTSRRSISSMTGRRSRSASGAGSGGARWWRAGTPTVTSRCCASLASPVAKRSGS